MGCRPDTSGSCRYPRLHAPPCAGSDCLVDPASGKRRAGDRVGLFAGRTTGTPLCALIRNADTRSADYQDLTLKPRPSHADLTGMAVILAATIRAAAAIFLAG
jgi:hypothetical protein